MPATASSDDRVTDGLISEYVCAITYLRVGYCKFEKIDLKFRRASLYKRLHNYKHLSQFARITLYDAPHNFSIMMIRGMEWLGHVACIRSGIMNRDRDVKVDSA
jgi:hypothetical protein